MVLNFLLVPLKNQQWPKGYHYANSMFIKNGGCMHLIIYRLLVHSLHCLHISLTFNRSPSWVPMNATVWCLTTAETIEVGTWDDISTAAEDTRGWMPLAYVKEISWEHMSPSNMLSGRICNHNKGWRNMSETYSFITFLFLLFLHVDTCMNQDKISTWRKNVVIH